MKIAAIFIILQALYAVKSLASVKQTRGITDKKWLAIIKGNIDLHKKVLDYLLVKVTGLETKRPNKECKYCKDCSDLLKWNGNKENGVYTIYPSDKKGPVSVYCDMKTDGGGWTVFQRRQDGSVDFYRNWNSYKNGFGNLKGEFWLGNDFISRLASQKKYELRVDLQDTSGNKKYAKYGLFDVSSEGNKYKLSVGKYSGNAGDSMQHHNGRYFTTKDRDNDGSGSNCAALYKGAWWYGNCHHSNLNGLYLHGKHKSNAVGVNWNHWKGHKYSLKKTEMKMRPVGF